jgi:UDP-glucose 4-epimerase
MILLSVEMQRLMVTGANGLLGRALLKKLTSNYLVSAIVREIPKNDPVPGVNYIEIDFSSDWKVSELPIQMDIIIHVAQSNKYKDFPSSAVEVFNVNLASTIKLLDYGYKTGIKKFVFASTGGLYVQHRLPLTEDSQIFSPDKLTHYLGTKLSSEVFATNYRPFFHVDILRIFFMYGPGQKSNMLIPRLVSSIRRGDPVTLAGDYGIKLNPIYVDDVVDIISARLLGDDSQVFNVAGQEIVTFRQLSEMIGKLTEFEPIFNVQDKQPDLVSEFSRCADILGGSGTSLHQGLMQTLNSIDGISYNHL